MKGIGSIDLRTAVPGLLAATLAVFAYRLLFEYTASSSLEAELEQMMFNNSASGPPVVLVLVGWLAYRRWPRLRAISADNGSAWLAALCFAPCPLLFAWATYTGVADLLVLALMSNLVALVALLWGRAGLRVAWLPLVFLGFALHAPAPLINEVLWTFQIWTADYTGWLLRLMGLTAFVTGDQIIRPDQNYAIIETCSGLRSLESLTMLTVLMIDLFRRSGLHAAILAILAPLAAFTVNGFRAVTIILNPHSDVVTIHTLQGVMVLMVGLLIVYAVDGWLERFFGREAPAANRLKKRVAGETRPGRLVVVVAASAVLLGISVWTPRWEPPGRGARPFPSSQIPEQYAGWSSTRIRSDRQFMGIVSFRASVDRRYQRGQDAVRLFAGVGGHDKPRSSPFSPKSALPGSGWWIEQSDMIVLEPDERSARVRVVRYGMGARRKLVFDWNEGTDGFVDEVFRAASALDKSAWSRDREGVSLRISTRLDGLSAAERDAAQDRLRDFYRAFRPRFDLLGTPRGNEPPKENLFPM